LLSSGDYVCGPETVVERKTVLDLHLTIAEGRLWPQLKGIREAGRSPCLLIEGEHLYRGAIDADSIRGALLAAADRRHRSED
jgi:ERCC4-type nuclease